MEKLDELRKEKITITIDNNDYEPNKEEIVKFEDKKTNNEITDFEKNIENNLKNFIGIKRKSNNLYNNNKNDFSINNNYTINNISINNFNNDYNDTINDKDNCIININQDDNNENHFIINNDYSNKGIHTSFNINNTNNEYQKKYFLGLRYSIEDFIFNKRRDFSLREFDSFVETIQEKISKRKLNSNSFNVRNIFLYIIKNNIFIYTLYNFCKYRQY